MRARRVGQHALLVECADLDAVAATYATLREHRDELGAVDVVPAARTVLLDGVRNVDAATALLGRLAPAEDARVSAGDDIV
jgi:hypothetical protein